MSQTGPALPPVRFNASWASVHFDLIRGIAAFLVFFEHWRNLFFVDFPQISSGRLLLVPFYILATVGHQSVVVFFVLSGYFIGGTVFRSLERNQWSWLSYLVRRLVRLWTVLIPALLLCVLWDRLGIYLGHAPGLYSGRDSNMVGDVAQMLTLKVFLSNLFFLQKIYTTVLGSNGPLWSLANEFWYYILFPLGVIAVWRNQRTVLRLICVALLATFVWFTGRVILQSFPIWLAGVMLCKVPSPSFSIRTAKRLRIAATLVYAPLFFCSGRLPMSYGLPVDYVLTILTFFYLWILLSDTQSYSPRARSVRASRELARFSYTLYAVHVPILVFVAAFVLGDKRWYPTPAKLLAGIGVMLLTFAYAWTLAFFIEFRTDTLREHLERLFGIASAPPMLPSNPMAVPSQETEYSQTTVPES